MVSQLIVSEWKYLGAVVSGKRFSFSVKNDLSSFDCATNSILFVLNKPDEEVQIKLLYVNCIPILSYASVVKTFHSPKMSQINTAINDAIRSIFLFN
jgi:hypothetical protein